MSSFIALFSGVPNRSFRIVCIRVQWNHSDLSGCAPRVGDCLELSAVVNFGS